MKYNLEKHEVMLFELLKSSLHQNEIKETIFKESSQEDWNNCYKLAVQQGVMALAWDGISYLPSELRPHRSLRLKWALSTQKYEERYHHYCKIVQKLSTFYASHGIAMLLLKGIGLSSYYVHPEHREGGDIDIFTYSADPNVMTDSEANQLADQLMIEKGINVCSENAKHSIFYMEGIMIENHKSFLDIKTFNLAVPVESILKRIMNSTTVSLWNGDFSVKVPSISFNTVFVAFHTFQHFGDGLSLHHLCDWATILSKNGLQIPDEIKDRRFLTAISSFTAFTNLFLGTNIPIEYSETELDNLFYEMLRSPLLKKCQSRNYISILLYKTRHFLYYRHLRKKMMGESMLKAFFYVAILHIKNPKKIFRIKK